MSNLEQLVQVLDKMTLTSYASDRRKAMVPILRTIVKACRERDLQELDQQAEAFLSLTYDPANIFLGFSPEPPSIPPEIFDKIESEALAVLEKIAVSENDDRD
jgi:hypothetical protein